MFEIFWARNMGGVALVGFQSTYTEPHSVPAASLAVLLAIMTVSPENVHEPFVKSVR